MTVLELLKNASIMLNLDQEFEPYLNEESTLTPSDETEREWGKMLSAFNCLIKKIATERIPVVCEEEIVFDACGEFELSSLINKFHGVQMITGYSGLIFARETRDGKLKADYVGPAILRYSYIPEDLTTEDNISVFENLSSLVFSYGIAYIYCEMSSLFGDAEMWQEKFESAINECMRGVVRERVMKVRRWL